MRKYKIFYIIIVLLVGVFTMEAVDPEIKILTPKTDQLWLGIKRVEFKILNLDPEELKSVDVYLNGNLIKELSKPPFSFNYNFGSSPKHRKLEVLVRTVNDVRIRKSVSSYYADDAQIIDVMQVLVPVVVTNSRGKYVSGLQKDDFILMEDGVQQDVSYFTSSGKSTFRLVLLIDISSSMKSKIAEVKEAGKMFLKQLLRKDDKALIVFFNHDVFEDSDFTGDIDELEKSLSIAFPFGATALYDAVAYSVKLLKSIMGRNIIILFSDGEDNSSAIDPFTLMKMVERSNSAIYAIGKRQDGGNEYQDLLKKLSVTSGGMPLFFDDVKQVRKLYDKINSDIRAKYVLQFSPKQSRKQNRFRKLSIRVKNKKYKIRTMKGYYY